MLKIIVTFVALLLMCGVGAGSPVEERGSRPQRIVSINLCTDLMLLTLAQRHQVASVTFLAANPDYSYLAAEVDGLDINHSFAEEIIPLDPDLILASDYTPPNTIHFLRTLGYRVEQLPIPQSIG